MTELYFIESSFKVQGRKWVGFVERDMDRMNLRNTVQDIIDGQVEGVTRVYRADLETGRFTDASEDVAREILNHLDGEPTGELLDFLEAALGCQAVAEFLREAA